jgi:hypothetical protein
MRSAMDFVRDLPLDEPTFTDFQSNLMLGHYLCDQRPFIADKSVPGFISYDCGGHRVIASATKYIFDETSFYDQLQQMTNRYHLQPGSKVYIAQIGWDAHLASELASVPGLNLTPRFFGSEIQFFELTVGQALSERAKVATSISAK